MKQPTMDNFARSENFSQSAWDRLHIDPVLLLLLFGLMALGLVVLSSSDIHDPGLLQRQTIRIGMGLFLMFVIAQLPIRYYFVAIPWIYVAGVLLLVAVLIAGDTGKGAQRWLDLKVIRFQPSEIMKLAVPMLIAYYFANRPLPCRLNEILTAVVLIMIPALLIARQPDLGTSVIIIASGAFVLFFAGLRWRYMLGVALLGLMMAPVLWHIMHDYQRARVLTFLQPENDPLGSGYHIIQSKIAIGSGGLFGKGWMNGTQSHLEFLPERSTDFIFAVLGEEFGFLGALAVLILYTCIILRGLYISTCAQDTFSRLLAGSLTLTFCFYVLINMGMVTGLLPVVGIPLPLISYGGTSIVTLLAGFGILMSIHTHRKLVGH